MNIKVTGGHVQIGDGNTQVVSGRCVTCKFWSPFDGQPYYDPIIVRNKLGLCSKIGEAKDRDRPEDERDWTYDKELPPDGTLAMADDASGLQSMRTAATFGCVLWEAK